MQLNLLLILIVGTLSACANEYPEAVEYYKQIWNENLESIKGYKRPTRNAEFENYTDDNINIGTFDFIIVGGGSSGAVLAARLSEIKEWKILLLDAGGNETDFSLMPGAFFPIQQTEINWAYLTTPQEKACFGCINNQCDFSRGKVLGGCSATNAMLYVRGNRGDFDDWCGPKGNVGWCYKDVLPYFKKLENASSITGGVETKYRGIKGPLSVTLNSHFPSYSSVILNGTQQVNISKLDYNAKRQLNVANNMQITIKNGKRHSTNQAYLQPALKQKRKNLRVETKALAIKIVVENGKLNKAKQIKFIKNRRTYVANASHEIILSAGAVNSPQLLMLSGIGPKDELKKHGINLISDLPVGENLEDHPTVFNIVINTNLTFTNTSFDDLLAEYVQGKGSLSHSYGQEVGFTYASANPKTGIPDVEYIFFQMNSFHQPDWVMAQANYDQIMINSLSKHQKNTILSNIMLLHPKSRGWIRLNSSNPIEFPLNNPNYLADDEDAETLINAIENLQKLLSTPSFRSINATFAPTYIKPCDSLKGRNYWDCVVRHKLQGIFHPVSTCRMGTDVKTSVVDNHLIVHGFHNLRVVDASAFPTSTSGHPNAVCIMMAEKIADVIKKKYNKAFLPNLSLKDKMFHFCLHFGSKETDFFYHLCKKLF